MRSAPVVLLVAFGAVASCDAKTEAPVAPSTTAGPSDAGAPTDAGADADAAAACTVAGNACTADDECCSGRCNKGYCFGILFCGADQCGDAPFAYCRAADASTQCAAVPAACVGDWTCACITAHATPCDADASVHCTDVTSLVTIECQ